MTITNWKNYSYLSRRKENVKLGGSYQSLGKGNFYIEKGNAKIECRLYLRYQKGFQL